jgi:hypothetical protein
MNLRWHSFERPARRLIEGEIAKSPALKKLRRKAPRKKARSLWLLLSCLWVLMPLGLARAAAEKIGSGLLVYALGSVPLIVFVATGWHAHVDRVADPVWHVYTFAREEILRERLRTFGRSLAYFSPIIFGGSIGLYFGGEILFVSSAIIHGILQAVVIVICGLHVAAYSLARRRAVGWIAILFFIMLTLGAFMPSAAEMLRESSAAILAALPAGWVHHVVTGVSWRDWIYLLPILLICIAIPQSARRLRHNFMENPVWKTDLESQSLTPSEMDDDRGEEEQIDPTIALARVSAEVREGPLEAAVARLWNDDQRQTAAFLWPAWHGWTQSWIGTAKFLLICVVLAAIGRFIFNFEIIVDGTLIIGTLGSLAASPLTSRATGLRPHGGLGSFSPLYAGFPLAYDSLYKTLHAVALVRWVTWMPLLMLYAAGVAWLAEYPTAVVLILAFKIGLTLLALLPATTTMWLGQTSSMTRQWPVFIVVFLLLLIAACAFVFVFAPIALDTSFPLALDAGLLAAIWILAKATQLFHRALYRGRCMDLLSKPQSN